MYWQDEIQAYHQFDEYQVLIAGKFSIAKRSQKQKEMREVGASAIDMQALHAEPKHDAARLKPKHIVVAWYEDNVGNLLTSLAGFAPENSTVTLISKERPEVSSWASLQPTAILLQ